MTAPQTGNQNHPRREETEAQQENVSKACDDQERLRELYHQQQRRLACPGCGEEPFLG